MDNSMERTNHFSLPYLMPSQAQKHVTHNEAIRMIDTLMQIAVESRAQTVPPAEPLKGARYLVPETGGEAWGHPAGTLCAFTDGAWMNFDPADGWFAWVRDEARFVTFSNGQWDDAKCVPDALQDLSLLGVNGTADAQNRLFVSSPASTFSHEGNDHRLTVNRATQADTASLLFSTDWNASAEIGLAGNRDLEIKYQNNTSGWSTSVSVSADTGKVSFSNGFGFVSPFMQPPELDEQRIIYLDYANGNDSLDGITAATAIKTSQRLSEILPVGGNVELRLLSDIDWDYAIYIGFSLAKLEIRGRNATDSANENRIIHVTDSVNFAHMPGCLRLRSYCQFILRQVTISLETAKNHAFLNFFTSSGYVRTLDAVVTRSGSGNCAVFGGWDSFVPSSHHNLSTDPSAVGFVAHSLPAGSNPNSDWRYPCNLNTFG